jgi:hypothetical protein
VTEPLHSASVRQQVNSIAYQPQQERAYPRLVPRALRSIERPNNANLKVKALGVGERERTSHDLHVGAGRGRPSLRREFVDVLRQLGRPACCRRATWWSSSWPESRGMGGGVSLTETVGGIDMQCNKGRAMRDGLHRTSPSCRSCSTACSRTFSGAGSPMEGPHATRPGTAARTVVG